MYNHAAEVFERLKPMAAQHESAMVGFPYDGWDGSLTRKHLTIPKGQARRVQHRPVLGICSSQGKWWPSNYDPLTCEFTLGGKSDWLGTGSRTPAGGTTPCGQQHGLEPNLGVYLL